MAQGTGSRTWFRYTSTYRAASFAINQDKSNANSSDLGFTPANQTDIRLILNKTAQVVPRYVNCYRIQNDEVVRRRFIVGTDAAMTAIADAGVVAVDGFTYFVTSIHGETLNLISAIDTGLTDPVGGE